MSCSLNSAVLNSKLGLVGHCGWELGKDFLNLDCRNKRLRAKTETQNCCVAQKPKVQMQSHLPACCSSCVLGGASEDPGCGAAGATAVLSCSAGPNKNIIGCTEKQLKVLVLTGLGGCRVELLAVGIWLMKIT